MNLFRVADDYCRASSWKTLSLVKFCLFFMGIIAGVLLARLGWDEATDPIPTDWQNFQDSGCDTGVAITILFTETAES